MKPAMSMSLRGRDKEHPGEILSLTTAAVQALSALNGNDKPGKTSVISAEGVAKHIELLDRNSSSSTGSFEQDQRDVLVLGANTSSLPSSSLQSTSEGSSGRHDNGNGKMDTSFLDSSFDRRSAQRVRIPARLLREIKSPQDRSAVSTGLQQPAPFVIRHVDGPSAWVSMAAPTSLTPDDRMTHPEPTTTTKTVFSHEVTQANDLSDQQNPTQNSIHKTHFGDQSGNGSVNEQVDNPTTSVLRKDKGEMHAGLYQGDPVTGGLMTSKSSNSTKAKCFSLSERERVLKEEFLKRKERKSAPVKRLVQPTVIPAKDGNAPTSKPDTSTGQDPVVSAAAIAAAAASAATAPFLQIQHGLESQISALVSSLHVLHEQHAKLEHHKVIEEERRLQQQLDARLQKLEEIQKQILESQNPQSTVQPRYPSMIHTSTTASYPQPPTLVTSSAFGASSSAVPGPVITYQGHHTQPTIMGDQKPPVPYVPAAQHLSHRAAQTQTISTTKDTSSKLKLVKNSRTQTSPQDSTLSSSDSPLQTPLPRKRPPLPMSRDSLLKSHAKELQYSELPREKRVHFNDPALRQLQPYSNFARMQSYPEDLIMNKPNAHFQAFRPQRESIQEKEKLQASDTREVVDDLNRIKKDLRSVMVVMY